MSRLFNITKASDHPISTQYEHTEKDYKKLHYHDDIQLTFIKKGKGMLIYENSTIDFDSNSLLVIGSRKSHVFVGDVDQPIELFSLYFRDSWLKNVYPNSNFIEHFLNQTNSGIHISNYKNGQLVENALNQSGIIRITSFLEVINKIGDAKKTLISTNSNIDYFQKNLDSDRLNSVYNYISKNYTSKLSLEAVSNLANMEPQSFCRYFKNRTQKTMSQFVAELRINKACKDLISTDFTVEEICYSSGYNNFSNFIRQFKKHKNMTPKEFRKSKLTQTRN